MATTTVRPPGVPSPYERKPLDEIDQRTVFERMLAIIGELPAIGKTQKNKEQGFMFRGHDDVMNALNPLLAKHGVFVVPDVIERETNTRTTSKGSTMYEVNLHVRFTFYGAGGDSFVASGWGEGTDMGDKATNKAMTGAFKYVVAQAFALATAEVSDADLTSPEETTRGSVGSIGPSGAIGQRMPRGPGQGEAEFDPGKRLLDGAIDAKTADDETALMLALRDLDPSQDWAAIRGFLEASTFGDKTPTAADWGAFWKRLANACVRANEQAGPGDFPPPSAEILRAAFAWAFDGVAVAFRGDVTASQADPDREAAEAAERDTAPLSEGDDA